MILGLRLGGLGDGAQLAEKAALDFVFLGDTDGAHDGPVGHDPLSVAAFLMTTTKRIGLAASVADSWAPFNVARALASFDLLSGGRGGWMPLTAGPDADAARSAEHLDVVRQLFDSWDDDALVFDKANSIFADRNKVRRIQHSGAYFTVDGPLNAPRPSQGQPVLFQRLDAATPFTDVALTDLADLRAATRKRVPASSTLLLAEVPVDLTSAGASEALVARLTEAFTNGDCDGFLFAPTHPSTDIARLADEVIPRLQAAGLAAKTYAAGDFRSRIGLPRPVNRFSGVAVHAST